MSYIKVVSSFRHAFNIIMSLVASQINGSEMLTKEPHRTTERSEESIQLKFCNIKLRIRLIFFISECSL